LFPYHILTTPIFPRDRCVLPVSQVRRSWRPFRSVVHVSMPMKVGPVDGSSPDRSVPERRSTKPFRIEFDAMSRYNRLRRKVAAERQLHSDRILRVLVGSGRGCTLHGNAMPPTVIVPLRKSVRLSDGESVRMLRP